MGLRAVLNISGRDNIQENYFADRRSKGQRIISQLSRVRSLKGVRVLDYGAGYGLIAQTFVDVVGPAGEVVAADVSNKLAGELAGKRLKFVEIIDGCVPEGDESFDIIVSIHVLEHVGPDPAQFAYLAECHRLLRNDGIMYLATPNRWTVIEAHYRLPLVSWWPVRWRARYLRLLARCGAKPTFNQPMHDYRIWPHSRKDTRQMLEAAGFTPVDITKQTARQIAEIELTGFSQKLVLMFLPLVWWLFAPILPAHVFLCTIK